MTELKFSELALAAEVHRGIADAGFTYCTPIQSKALPLALSGRDVAGQAQTGTGKTAAYLIALYQYLLTHEPLEARQGGPRALILAPTRELAVQIHSDATLLGAHLPYRLGLAFGGTDYEKQKRHLAEGVDVLIGTPGRLIDFFKQGVFALRRVQVAVLDEADRMFDLGFLRDIRYILRRLPPPEQRLNMLFSATLSYRVLELAYEHMNDPELIRIEPDKLTVDRVRQCIYFPSNEDKLPLLISLLREMDAKRTMVFVNTRRGAEHLCIALEQNGIQAAALSGDVPQRKRLKLLRDFQAGELPVLIATDVASRGLHVPDVSHVFNYDLPQDAEDYVHRVGRTARAGASGDAISFGCEDYVVSLPDIEDYIGRKIDVATFDHEKLAEFSVTRPPRPRWSERRDGRPGGRDSRGGRRGPPGRRREHGEPAEAGAGRRGDASRRAEKGAERVGSMAGRQGDRDLPGSTNGMEAGTARADATNGHGAGTARADATNGAETGAERVDSTQRREQRDNGERRRSRRRRGRERNEPAADEQRSRGGGEPGDERAREPSSADDTASAKRPRRRRGRRGSGSRTTGPDRAPASERERTPERGEPASRRDATARDEPRRERDRERDERPPSRNRARGRLRDGDAGRVEPAPARDTRADEPRRGDDASSSHGNRPAGLLARLWSAIKR